MKKYIFLFYTIILCSCGELTKDYYYVISPNDSTSLTIVNITWLVDPSRNSDKLESGIYLFYGHIKKSSPFPNEYLKLKYSDYSPIGIAWGDTIKIAYNYIERNTFDSNKNIIVFNETSDPEYQAAANFYKEKTGNVKTAYDLDEIFRNYK